MIRLKKKTRNIIFYIMLISLPCLHFLVFWVGGKFNAIFLAFKSYEGGEHWVGFDNFRDVFHNIAELENWHIAIKNSLLIFVLNNIATVPPTLLVAYFIHKKGRLGKAFKVIEYLPSIFSMVVQVTVYQYFCEEAIPTLIQHFTGKPMMGLISGLETRWWTIWFFRIWMGIGGSMILYINQMNSISDSITEAAALDGVTFWQEFWKITMPMCWSLFALQFIVSFTGIFGGQFNLVEFYGLESDSDLQTVGYYMYTRMLLGGEPAYPQLSAMGLIITVIMVPLLLFMRWGADKIDPMQ